MSEVTELELPEGAEGEVASALGKLTETQHRRVLKRVGGASLARIAQEEGRAISTIDESLKAPAVQEFFSILGCQMRVKEDGELINPVLGSLSIIYSISQNATRAVVVSDGDGRTHLEQVPDYATRLAAASKFLGLVDKPPPAAASDTLEVEQTETRSHRTRVRQTRKAPV
jgi:hypothetical protein